MSLARYGYNDIVYRMANQTDCPSYGYWVEQGYTTTPEYWDVGAFSQNHCMMDHIEEWFFSLQGDTRIFFCSWHLCEQRKEIYFNQLMVDLG